MGHQIKAATDYDVSVGVPIELLSLFAMLDSAVGLDLN